MLYSFHKHIQKIIIRKLNALLAVLEVTHISSSSKREEGVLLALKLPGYRSPVCNLKMYLHCFWSGSGMACKQYCPNSLWILLDGLGSVVQTYGCTRNPYLNST